MLRTSRWESSARYLALAAGAAIMVLPFAYMVSTALQGQVYALDPARQLIPQRITLENFVAAWTSNRFEVYFTNSAIVATTATTLSILFAAMMAYAFARFAFPGKEALFYAILFTLMIPGLMLIIPQFLLAKALGLRNSLWGLIVVYVAGTLPLNTFLLRGFFEQLPRELEEAVLIDGGSHLTIFWRIVLPLSKPALATVAIFTFLATWDEFAWAVTAIDDPRKWTLPVAIASFRTAHATQWGLLFAASLIAMVPVLLLFAALQRYFIEGLTAGAIRG